MEEAKIIDAAPRVKTSLAGSIGHPAKRVRAPFSSSDNLTGFESRIRTINDVLDALRDNSVTKIGICGMPGVGKTTLVKELADKVIATNLFDEVAFAVVSKDTVLQDIQMQIAEPLKIKIDEKTHHLRAKQIHTALMQTNKNILVIFDDLWKELNIHDIGIPASNVRGGLKVLLTSRLKSVCNRMSTRTFEVELLSEKEAWDLLKVSANISDYACDIKDIALEVLKECGGLPLAIIVAGMKMRGSELDVWMYVLRQLKRSKATISPDIRTKVNSSIKLSYDYLDKDSKSVILLCSLFPKDYNIPLEDLIRYAKGLLWHINVKTMKSTREKVTLIKENLINCYLLLPGSDEKHVKLHYAVRNVCLSIASSGELMHMVRHEGLTEWPQDYIDVSSTAISLTLDRIVKLSCDFEYPALKLLRLSFTNDTLCICSDFFGRMKGIKVLELCNLSSKLPSSFQSLVNLRTLCFHGCKLVGDMSVIGSQQKLEILSFYNSYLEYFPDQISNLRNLKYLDLRFAGVSPTLPWTVLRLQNIEELYFNSYE